ncbi:MAG: prepilin peptidase [Acidobacteria bacterium]|nr:MAG: prepilin peptidase [Acidobacteriota bacterium]
MLQVLLLSYGFLFGLVVGSYLNVVVHRLPRGQSTVTPRSRCPSCGHLIRWYDNLPLVSWLVLGGHCRRCDAAISLRYPLVEASTGALFTLALWRFGATASGVVACALLALLLALALIDAEHYLLPDKITKPGMLAGLGASFVVEWTTPVGSVLALLGGAGVLYALIGLWWLVRRQQGMGLGDPKMLAMVGAFLGPGKTVLTLFLACLLGTVVATALIATRRAELGSRLPFGVYLAVGAALALLVGDPVLDWYLGLLVR